jgi:nucleoside-diphosphate-sugar epimerase
MNSASSVALRDRFNSSQLELVLVEDVATDQGALKEAMIGVDAVAHTASP